MRTVLGGEVGREQLAATIENQVALMCTGKKNLPLGIT